MNDAIQLVITNHTRASRTGMVYLLVQQIEWRRHVHALESLDCESLDFHEQHLSINDQSRGQDINFLKPRTEVCQERFRKTLKLSICLKYTAYNLWYNLYYRCVLKELFTLRWKSFMTHGYIIYI
jgi:hypothetical protein